MTAFEREDIVVSQLVSGHRLTIPVFRFRGTGNGPRTYIQANVHGAELQGNAVIYALIRGLSQSPAPIGDIVLVPHANPYGGNQKMGDYTYGRFDPVSGNNWNRLYWPVTCRDENDRRDKCQVNLASFIAEHGHLAEQDFHAAFKRALAEAIEARKTKAASEGLDYGRRLCLTLQGLAAGADIVLDLHTGQNATRYLYAPEYAAESARLLDIPFHLLIPDEFSGAMDESCFAPWWHLQKAAAARGHRNIPVEAFTLEMGGQERIDLEEAEQDARGILNYLHHKGVVSTNPGPPRHRTFHSCLLKDFRQVYAPVAGLMDYAVQPGQFLKKGQPIGTILSLASLQPGAPVDSALTTVPSPHDGVPLIIFSSSAVNRDTDLLTMMTNITTFQG
ncbi:MAG: M14 family metallopeptidase [Acidobacteriota bacterium]|nr:M14 family metallopeptidase [Acidobacteriota bacterium]